MKRPWTVHALVLLALIGFIIGLVSRGGPDAGDLASLAFTVWISYSLWAGKRWAFTLSFMGGTLCLGFLILFSFVQLLLLDEGLDLQLVPGVVMAGAWVALLVHPETKRFAGLSPGRTVTVK